MNKGTQTSMQSDVDAVQVSTKEVYPRTTMDDRAHERDLCVTCEFQIQRTIPITKLICCVFNALLDIL